MLFGQTPSWAGRTRLLALCTLALAACGTELNSQDHTPPTSAVHSSAPSSFIPGARVHVMPKHNPLQDQNLLIAPAGSHLTYYGGHVISNVQVVQVLWGSGSYMPQITATGAGSMGAFYGGITNSPYFDWLSEYDTNITASGGQQGTNQSIGRGTFSRQVQITPSTTGTTIDDSAIQSELAAQINAGNLPAPTADAAGNLNTIYMVDFPAGYTITQGTSQSCVDFCAYHGTFSLNGKSHYYGVLPDVSAGSACAQGCGTSSNLYDNQTSVASHELVEAVTDGEIGLASSWGPPIAWYDQTNGEIGDICNGTQGTVVGGDGVTYVVQTEFSNVVGDCIVSRATTTTNDFSLTVSPTSGSLTQNTSGNVTVSTAVTSGSAQSVSLSISGLPSGASASFNPTSVTAGGSSTLTLNAGTAAAGTYSLTITGTGASTTHTATFSFTVTAPVVVNDFSLAANPTSLSLTQGTTGTTTLSTAVTSGSAQTVSFSVAGLPSGASASFSSTSVTAGGSSILSINAGTAAAGTYNLTVTGAGTSTHSVSLSLTVTAPVVVNDFSLLVSPTSLSVTQSTSGSVTVGTTTTSGSAQAVSFSVSGLPTGASASFSPASVSSGNSSSLTINAGTATVGSYTLTITGTGTSKTHTATLSLSVTAPVSTGSLANPGFETGTLSGWTASGITSVVSGGHSGTYAAQLGSTNPSTDSALTQTFTLPTNATTLTVWYKMTCPDTISYDWAIATMKDNATGTTTTVLPKTCTTNTSWASAQVSVSSSAGHSVTLTLSNHDDNYAGDATYTRYDDVTIGTGTTPPPPPPPSTGVTNGTFETGTLSGWTTSGASATASTSAHHTGTYGALLGSTGPTNGDSSITQTFTAPSGVTKLSFWYANTCPDTVSYDWATATLKDNTAGKTTTILAKTCTKTATWTNISAAVTAGHSYTLTLTSHDDNYAGDATYTFYDDVTLQ